MLWCSFELFMVHSALLARIIQIPRPETAQDCREVAWNDVKDSERFERIRVQLPGANPRIKLSFFFPPCKKYNNSLLFFFFNLCSETHVRALRYSFSHHFVHAFQNMRIFFMHSCLSSPPIPLPTVALRWRQRPASVSTPNWSWCLVLKWSLKTWHKYQYKRLQPPYSLYSWQKMERDLENITFTTECCSKIVPWIVFHI